MMKGELLLLLVETKESEQIKRSEHTITSALPGRPFSQVEKEQTLQKREKRHKREKKRRRGLQIHYNGGLYSIYIYIYIK